MTGRIKGYVLQSEDYTVTVEWGNVKTETISLPQLTLKKQYAIVSHTVFFTMTHIIAILVIILLKKPSLFQ